VVHDAQARQRRWLVGEDLLHRNLDFTVVGDDDGQKVVGAMFRRSRLRSTAGGEREAQANEQGQEQAQMTRGFGIVCAFLVGYSSNGSKRSVQLVDLDGPNPSSQSTVV